MFPYETLTWKVLAVEGNDALIVTEKAIDAQPYNEVWADVRWENCTLRAWLNSEFLDNAFSERERRHIRLTYVVNGTESSVHSLDQGPDTQDYVFLLSPMELKKYFPGFDPWNENNSTQAQATTYTVANGGERMMSTTYNARYWLRSTGTSTGGNAALIEGRGQLMGLPVQSKGCVRPALWVDIRALEPAADESSRIDWTVWIGVNYQQGDDQSADSTATAIIVTVTAQTVCLRDAAGNPLEYLSTGTRLTVTDYSSELESFAAVYNGKAGYIKGIGLNYTPDELRSMLGA